MNALFFFTGYSTDFKVPLAQLREIHSRRFNMSRTAIEIFLVDQTNYFINFPDKKVRRRHHSLSSHLLHLQVSNEMLVQTKVTQGRGVRLH